MSLKLLTLLALGISAPGSILAQDTAGARYLNDSDLKGVERDTTDLYRKDLKEYKSRTEEEYKYNTFTSGDTNVHKFDNKSRAFRDWSISVGGGLALMSRGDLTSFCECGKVNPGYNVYVSLDKQISHTFGLSLQYQFGQTNQKGRLLPYDVVYPNNNVVYQVKNADVELRGLARANTKYHQVSLLGDLNLSNLFRRVDNRSVFRWALHAYLGLGLQGFETQRWDSHPRPKYDYEYLKQDLNIASFFYQGGLGLSHNVNRFLDLEARVMYVISGDDEFDGGGDKPETWPGYNMIKKNDSDNMFSVNLGMSFKLGRKENKTHLRWYDPLREIYYRTELLQNPRTTVCENGDKDNDGVCDDWDRQLNTPAGARVDGAGVALDTDLDGVMDLEDKCVTTPRIETHKGCPEKLPQQIDENAKLDMINRFFEGIEFALNKDVIRPSSYETLDNAVEVIKSLEPDAVFLVVGATDTRASDAYNLDLSRRRANAVVKYLVDKGVYPNMLLAEGRGERDLKYPECEPASNCPEWKNEANRRVYFIRKK